MFNLIPTDPDEYKVYADWLEDQGVVLTASIRRGILLFSEGQIDDFQRIDEDNYSGGYAGGSNYSAGEAMWVDGDIFEPPGEMIPG